jgi:hypothetical protein
MILAILASTASMLQAIIATGATLGGSASVRGLASVFNIEITAGRIFLALSWASAITALVGSAYWCLIWFVEFRQTAFSRRQRKGWQMGDWRGIITEVRRDLRIDGHNKI